MTQHNINYDLNINTKICKSNSYKFIFMFFCIILFNSQLHSQTSQNYAIQDYKYSEIEKIENIISQIQDKKSLGYLNLLPNISYNHNPINNNHYISIGINLNSFTNYFQQKHRNKIEVQKIKNSLLERLSVKINRLENEYEKITLDIENLKFEASNLELVTKIYELKKTQYENNKINLESWLKIQLDYNKQKRQIKNKKNSIKRRLTAFYKKINSPVEPTELNNIIEH